MYHHDESRCGCTVFHDKDLSLKMLSIHSILVQCERYFFKHRNFDGISDFYNVKSLCNFTFFVFVEFLHESQYKIKQLAAKCNLLDFFKHLKYTFNLSKMIDVNIGMVSEREFECYVTMKIWGRKDFELIGGLEYWDDLETKDKNERNYKN